MRNKQRIVISILIVVITAITFGLGILMYFSNQKSTRQNIIVVELADFAYNTNYSMRFGKQIETFFGMDEQLLELQENYDEMLDLYILDEDDRILFSTSREAPEERICALESGGNLITDSGLYCMYGLTPTARILVRTDSDSIIENLVFHMRRMGLRALIGALISIALTLLLSIVIKNKRLSSILPPVLLAIWIVTFGILIGRSGYIAYQSSRDTVFEAVTYTINTDLDKVRAFGVPDDGFYEVDEYLQRYSDMIPDIDAVRMDGKDIRIEKSASYERKILLDYSLQTLLLLTFSIIIITEQHIYSKNTEKKEEEARDGTD